MGFTSLIFLLACLAPLFAVSFAYGQETPAVLKPNQLITFSLAPVQEKVFVLQMKKGDFADIQWLAREDLNLSFEIYDSERKHLLEKSEEGDRFIWYVAPRDGDFVLVSGLAKEQYPEIYDAQKISIQYNNKFRLPPRTKLKAVRKVKGFDVKIMTTPESSEGSDSVLLIEKNGQLQKAMKKFGGGIAGFSFMSDSAGIMREIRTTADKAYKNVLAKQLKSIQLIETTVDKKGNGIPDIVIEYDSGARAGSSSFFFDLDDAVKTIKPAIAGLLAIGRNSTGGLVFEDFDGQFQFWFTSACMACARPAFGRVLLEFRNGGLRPNFDLMKKPPPSLAVLRSRAQKLSPQFSLTQYRGAKDLNAIETNLEGEELEDPGLFSKEYLDDTSPSYVPPFWNEMIDLIYAGNEELAWQFLDLIWPQQKQGKALFIRDFKKQLLESQYWQMILEDKKK